MIQQFGYDLNNKPVPNEADSAAAAEGGTFTTSSLTDKFLSNFMANPKTWPVAPLDLRLDRERGVWTTPPPPRPLHATNDGCILDDGTSDVNNIKPNTVDENGGAIGSPTIDVEWPWTPSPPSGIGKFPSYYDNIDCAHYAFPIYRLDVQQQDEYEANNTDLIQDINRLVFGSGFEVTSQLGTCVNSVFIDFTGVPTGTGGGGGGIYVQGDDCSVSGGALSFAKTEVVAGGGGKEIIQFGDGLQMADLGDTVGITAINYISGIEEPTGEPVTCEEKEVLQTYETLLVSGTLVLKATGEFDDPCKATLIGYPAQISGYVAEDDFQPPNWCSGFSPTDGTRINPACYPLWIFDKGMTINPVQNGDQSYLEINSAIQVQQSGSCNTSEDPPFMTSRLIFGTGMRVTTYDDGVNICATHINGNYLINGYSGVGTANVGASDKIGLRRFEQLNFGKGIVVTSGTISKDCNFEISAEKFISSQEACGTTALSKANFTHLAFGSGLSVATSGDTEQDEAFLISTNNQVGSSFTQNKYGFITEDAQGNVVSPGPATVCAGDGDDPAGPYPTRRAPGNWNKIEAGMGIGITSCSSDPCTALLFNNTTVGGVARSGSAQSCESIEMAQVSAWEFDSNFYIAELPTDGTEPFKGGGSVNSSSGSLAVKIGLNIDPEDAGTTLSWINNLTVERDVDGHITDIIKECCSITVKKTCGDNYIITAIEDCSCTAGTAATVVAPPP